MNTRTGLTRQIKQPDLFVTKSEQGENGKQIMFEYRDSLALKCAYIENPRKVKFKLKEFPLESKYQFCIINLKRGVFVF